MTSLNYTGTPYATRGQRVASVDDAIISNIAEYAAMRGIPYKSAYTRARHCYLALSAAIHRTRYTK